MPVSAENHPLVVWTIRAALAAYAARVLFDVHTLRRDRTSADDSHRERMLRFLRIMWTLGWLLYVVHVFAAFGLVHEWSHAAAYAHVADRTEAATGWRSGSGLYLNHLVTLVWTVDVALWWAVGPRFPDRHPVHVQCLHGFLGFMVFNATVVFGPPVWRWVGALFVALLAWLGFRGKRLGP